MNITVEKPTPEKLEKLKASDKLEDIAVSDKAEELLEIQPKNELDNPFQQNVKSVPSDFDKAKFLIHI